MTDINRIRCILNGEPSETIPPDAVFIGMEKDPNKPPRYGRMAEQWHNYPCFVTVKGGENDSLPWQRILPKID